MHPRLINLIALVAFVLSASLLLQGCNQAKTTKEPPSIAAAPTEEGTPAEAHSHAPGTPSHSHEAQLSTADWVELDHFRFKLAPEIQKGGQAHLDLYVHDAQDQPVSNAEVALHLTAADGHKNSITLVEEKAAQHYTGTALLDDLGDYQAVATVTIQGRQLNPRFSFTRQQ